MNIRCLICLLSLGGLTATGYAQSSTFGRVIPYPTDFEIIVGPNGERAAVPTRFTTRRTGASAKVRVAGVVRRLTVKKTRIMERVRLTLDDGRSTDVNTGGQLKLSGEIYQAMGFRKGFYVLKGMKSKKTLYFKNEKA
ncbi:MAG: hypothetical protein AAF492_30650, partial [Verrucomicrobiota bacterium]